MTDEWLTDYGDIVDTIRDLRPGDTVRIRTEPKTTPNPSLTVIDGDTLGEAVDAVSDRGTEYVIEPLYTHQLETRPWLRRDGESAGPIGAIQV
ncbi:hypothetical protein PN419_00485 [Halorubrum ezzemoulense]|uniref:hypothetical protein n=1 Tax=Halorubrum ezzemoulense TaxID=337243 RepID=UPI00232D5E99|nr:hypothetical protein [Halorubrum ezzemoulense]MDB9247484.1 hypothetical protein [Halorubrum ezzemoulense]MDB9258607.1 hypothetical protein [Halorubrum ezzemoulense]MDB9264534.1 hypothetical protein [Halorubrum ezzemoulense]MDB9268968.1 hypothetical protein [Halorubrum ezzemoulense]MDB9271502.1 hypothetical protein [Halorubrum ezzemoulense]